jgi:hypothetical protein
MSMPLAPDAESGELLHVVHLADATVVLRCDPRLGGLHARLRMLFDVSGRASGASRTITVTFTPDGDGIVVRSANLRALAGDSAEAVSLAITAVNAEVLLPSRYLTIHSGAVLAAAGVVAWPAPSGAGKSTLVAAALLRGFGLVSDEALCLDPDRRCVVPYPRPLTLDGWAVERLGLGRLFDGGGDASGEIPLTAGDLGATAANAPGALAAVVLIRRGAQLSLERTPSDQAAAALLRHSFNHWRMPIAALETVHGMLQTAAAWTLVYDDPVEAADLLADTFPPPISSTAE